MDRNEFIHEADRLGFPVQKCNFNASLWEAVQKCYIARKLDWIEGQQRHRLFAQWACDNLHKIERLARRIIHRKTQHFQRLERTAANCSLTMKLIPW